MKTVSLRLMISASAFALAASAASYPVKAQSQDQNTAASNGGLEEITVTARKREEKLLDVPISITALSSKTLEEAGIASVQDIAKFTPGLTLDTNTAGSNRNDRSFNVFVIRGMFPSSTNNPTTSVFIDGAPITTNQISGLDDVERVEILKGPQSAYFGRETFAGAINVVTRDPSKSLDGYVDALVGSRNYRDLRGMLEGSLIDDILTARATFRDYARDGSYKNTANPATVASPGETIGDQSTRSGTLEFVLTPIDDLKIKAFGTMWEDDDGPSPQVTIEGYQQGNCYGTYFCGQLPIARNAPAQNTLIDQYVNAYLNSPLTQAGSLFPRSDAVSHYGLHRDAYHAHLNGEYYVEALGFTVSTLTAVNKQAYSTLIDLDDSDSTQFNNVLFGIIPGVKPYFDWPFQVEGRSFDYSQELRLTSDQDQRFRWSVGASYLFSKTSSSLTGLLPYGITSTPPSWNEQTTIGVFYGLSYDILEDLTLSFEGRYQVDEEEPYTSTGLVAGKSYTHNFIPRTSLQYKFMPDWMAYATYSEGVNPAASNIGSVAQLSPAQLADAAARYGLGLFTQPEQLKNYEIGVKGRFWDNKATLSADVYYDIWTNQIVSAQLIYFTPAGAPLLVSPYLNIGKTTLRGIELDGTLDPIDHVSLNGGFALNGTHIDHYVCNTCAQITGSTYVNGNQLANVSKYQGTIGAKYTDQLSFLPGFDWYARLDYIYKSGTYDLTANLVQAPDTNLVNLKVGIDSGDIRVEFFVDNLTNNKAYTSIEPEYAFTNTETFAKDNAITAGLPNLITFGVHGKFKFGAPKETAETATAAYTPPPVQAPAMAHSYMVFFDFNKSDLTPQAASIVDQAAANAATAKATTLGVTGYTDTVGSDAYNMRLSRRRAESVAAKLEKDGIPASEIGIVAKGKHDLLVPTADGVKEPQNRRVTIVYGGAPTS